jgi:hypothetical protein
MLNDLRRKAPGTSDAEVTRFERAILDWKEHRGSAMPNEVVLGVTMALVVIAVCGGAMLGYVRLRRRRSGSRATSHRGHAQFAMVAHWYAGKQCSICGRDISPLSHFGPPAGLLRRESSSLNTISWLDVPADQIARTLETYVPVCSSCHLMTWFQHEHADLLVDRHRNQDADVTVH